MRKKSIEQKWHQLSEMTRDEAEKLPPGKEREALERKARHLETASQINQWLSSAELKPLRIELVVSARIPPSQNVS